MMQSPQNRHHGAADLVFPSLMLYLAASSLLYPAIALFPDVPLLAQMELLTGILLTGMICINTRIRITLPTIFLGLWVALHAVSIAKNGTSFNYGRTAVSAMTMFMTGSGLAWYLAGRSNDENWAVPVSLVLIPAFAVLPLFILLDRYGIIGQSEKFIDTAKLAAAGLRSTELPMWLGMHVFLLISVQATVRGDVLRAACWALVCIMVVIIVLCAAKAALLGLFAAYVVAYMSLRRGQAKTIVLFGIAVAAIWGFIIVSGAVGIIAYDIQSHLARFQDTGELTRTLLYEELWEVIKEKPWVGIGPGEFLANGEFMVMRPWGLSAVVPHNNLLGMAAQAGLPAAGAYLLWILVVVRRLWKFKSSAIDGAGRMRAARYAQGCLAVIVYQQVFGLFHDTWAIKEQYLWIGLGIGLWQVHTTKFAANRAAEESIEQDDVRESRRQKARNLRVA